MPWMKMSNEVKVMTAILASVVVALIGVTTLLTVVPASTSSSPTPTSSIEAPEEDDQSVFVVEVQPKPVVVDNRVMRRRPVLLGRQSRVDHFLGDAPSKDEAMRLVKDSLSWIPTSPLPLESSVLSTPQLPGNPDYHPEVGNGHVATVIRSDTVYMNGLYNGYNISSHRAMLDSSLGYRITATRPARGLTRSFSLDLGRGYFTEGYSSPSVNITLRTYAHRTVTRVIVVELELSRDDLSLPVAVTLALNSGCKSDDVDIISRNGSLLHWRTREAEYEELAPTTNFYTKSSGTLEGTVVMSTGKLTESFLALSSVGVSASRVEADYNRAISLFQRGSLLSSHVAEWAKVWQRGRIDVQGDVNVARRTYASLYYLLSSLPFGGNDKEWPFIGLSPGGLAHGKKGKDYNGHVFWDQDTWMFPGLAFMHADLGKLMVETRTRTLRAAKKNAKDTDFQGARYPWESAYTGLETCPAWPYSIYEIHINGDIVMMIRQYWQLTHDLDLLTRQSGSEVVLEVAKFWASRVVHRKDDDSYRIYDVMPPDEFYWPVNDSAYTNNIAVLSLDFANQVQEILKQPMNKTWATIASKMYLPYDPVHDYHPEFQRYRLHETTKQADVVLLNFPLMVPMNDSTRVNDLTLYEGTIPKGTVPAMTWGMYLVGWLQLGNESKATELFHRSTKNAQEPFLVWTENADGHGAVNFLTGMGGYLQSLVFGYGGCRIHDDHLAFQPRLIPGTTHVKFVDIDYRGYSFDLGYDAQNMTLTLVVSTPDPTERLEVQLIDQSQVWQSFDLGKPIAVPRQRFRIRRTSLSAVP